MNTIIPRLSIHFFCRSDFLATAYIIVLCTQLVPIEGFEISPINVILMGMAPFIFIFKAPYLSKALLWGFLYWGVCFSSALFNKDMRFSTLGYLGMFVFTAITFNNLVQLGAYTIDFFMRLLRCLIIAYGVILIIQQVCMSFDIRSLALINLYNQHFLSLTRLPSLSLEPSHSARILTVAMLSYMRCAELVNNNIKLTIKDLFNAENRKVSIFFLWTMLTMGSGTAYIGLGLLCLYFLTRRTVIYVIPGLIALILIGNALEIKQFNRAMRVAQVSMSGDVNAIMKEDGSAASRVIPLVNTLTIDLTQKESWIGKGTSSYEKATTAWKRTTDKIAVVEQYGLVALLISLVWVYSCMIRRFLSLETLVFIFLFGMSLANIAYLWGCLMMFTVVRYLQVQQENGSLFIEKSDEN